MLKSLEAEKENYLCLSEREQQELASKGLSLNERTNRINKEKEQTQEEEEEESGGISLG